MYSAKIGLNKALRAFLHVLISVGFVSVLNHYAGSVDHLVANIPIAYQPLAIAVVTSAIRFLDNWARHFD